MTAQRPLLAIAAAILIAASLPAAAAGVLHRGHGAAPSTLDPHLNFGARDAWIIDDLFEGLVATSADGKIIPGAAESWDTSPDGTVWTFHLREGLKWSNGDPLAAADFVAGIVRTLDPATASEKAYYFYNVIPIVGAEAFNAGEATDPTSVGVAAPDDRTVVITLASPAPHALWLLTSFQTAPLHASSLAEHGERFTRPGVMVSNGAFMLSEMVPQSHLVLTRNPNYWGAADVALDEVVYHVTEDEAAELRRYRAGELDVTADFPADELDALRAELGDEVRTVPDLQTIFFSFNITRPPLDDIRVRQALSMAIDREVLLQQVLKTGAPPLYSYVPPVDPAYAAAAVAEKGMGRQAREAEARRLLAEAGFGPDNPLTLDILSTNQAVESRTAVAIAIMWKSVLGVEATFRNQEFQAWLDAFIAGDWEVFNDGFYADFPGALTYLTYMDPSSESGYFWQNEDFVRLMAEAKATPDAATANRLMAEAEQILLDQYIIAPISGHVSRHLVKPYVSGWLDNVPESHPSRFITVDRQP